MKFFEKLLTEAKQGKQKVYSLYEKIQDQDQQADERYSYRNIDASNDMLRSTLKFSTYAPLIVESYILLYGLYACYTIVKVMILAPIEFIMGVLNIVFKSLKLYKSRYVTMHSLVVIVVAYIFTLNEDIFDISFMYHLIRGQSTVKVYAIIFAIEASEIVMTKLGIFLYENIKEKLTNKQIAFNKLFPEFIVQSMYVFCHAYIIYIDFLIYSVVLNSSFESFVIFWSVVYLTKMKTAPSFGLGMDKYKMTLTDDSKYRFSRIIYFALFLSNQLWISIPSLGYKFFFIIVVEELFIIGKHLLYLLSSYRGTSDTSALQIREDMYKTMYLDADKTSIDRCVSQNFTVLPFAVFTIKIITTIIEANWEPNFLAYLTFYILLCAIAGLLITLVIAIKSMEEFAHQMRKKHPESPSPFINSICIDVIGRIIEAAKDNQNNDPLMELLAKNVINSEQSKVQVSSQKSSEKSILSPVKLKRATSFFESMLLHANQIQKPHEEQMPQVPQNSLQPVDQQNEEDFLNQSNNSAKSKVELRKMKSHV